MTAAGSFKTAHARPRDATEWGESAQVSGPGDGIGQITSIEARFNPGCAHAFHTHPNQEEVIYVLEGRVEQWIERERLELVAGDAVVVTRGAVHATYNDGDAPARILAILSPCVGPDGYEVTDVSSQQPWASLR